MSGIVDKAGELVKEGYYKGFKRTDSTYFSLSSAKKAERIYEGQYSTRIYAPGNGKYYIYLKPKW